MSEDQREEVMTEEILHKTKPSPEYKLGYEAGISAGYSRAIEDVATDKAIRKRHNTRNEIITFFATFIGYLVALSIVYTFVLVVSAGWHDGEK